MSLYSNTPAEKRAREDNHPNSAKTGRVAIFWDESFLWGLIAYDTFLQLGIDFDVVTASDIRSGALNDYTILFVPGGWASNKIKSLGESGADSIRCFVEQGGSYLGFCGGAGMALKHRGGIALAPIGRKPTSIRVPSFSGKIVLDHERPGHPIWRDIPDKSKFHAWWPGQFSIPDSSDSGADAIKVLARYGEPENGSYVADIMISPDVEWDKWEQGYGTNLNPNRILGEPAIIEVKHGSGKVLLSYLHFETPGDTLGHRVLFNILDYLADGRSMRALNWSSGDSGRPATELNRPRASGEVARLARELESIASDLISFGENNSLWSWRNSWIIQWRRGVRGIEYCTLYAMLQKLSELSTLQGHPHEEAIERLIHLKSLIVPFIGRAKRLLALERDAISYGPISPLESGNEQIQRIREELFSNSKSFGGYYKRILDEIDALLLPLLIIYKSAAQQPVAYSNTGQSE